MCSIFVLNSAGIWKQLSLLVVQGSGSAGSSPSTTASLLPLFSAPGLENCGKMWPLPAWKCTFWTVNRWQIVPADWIKHIVVQTGAIDVYICLWLRSSWKCTVPRLYQREKCRVSRVVTHTFACCQQGFFINKNKNSPVQFITLTWTCDIS